MVRMIRRIKIKEVTMMAFISPDVSRDDEARLVVGEVEDVRERVDGLSSMENISNGLRSSVRKMFLLQPLNRQQQNV